MRLAACPLSRLTATAPPRGEPSLASPFGGGAPLWGAERARCQRPPPMGCVEALTGCPLSHGCRRASVSAAASVGRWATSHRDVAAPKGEPSLASPFGGRWCPVGTVQRLTEPAGESAPAGGGEGSVRPPSWCAAVREKRFAVSLAFFPALRAYKVKGKVETFLKKSFIKKLYSCYRLACSYSAITVTNRAFTSPPQRWPWGMVGLK